MVSSEIQAVIWDLDGTLLDSFGLYKEILAEILPPHGISVPEEDFLRHHYHGTLENTFHDTFGIPRDDKDAIQALVADFLAAQNKLSDRPQDHLFADALELAKRFHGAGKLQIVVSNRAHGGRDKASPRYIVENSELKSCIDTVICGDDYPFYKPDPRLLDEFMAANNLESGQLLCIGDQKVDAQLAKNLSTQAILVSRDDTIPHLQDLPDWKATAAVVPSLDSVLT